MEAEEGQEGGQRGQLTGWQVLGIYQVHTLVHAAVVFENTTIARAEAGGSCKIQGVSHGERTAES